MAKNSAPKPAAKLTPKPITAKPVQKPIQAPTPKPTAQPKTQRVTPRPEGGWQHKGDGNERATRVTQTQKEAIESAVEVAKRQGGEVVVHGKDGKIRSKDSYGNDPNPPKDSEH